MCVVSVLLIRANIAERKEVQLLLLTVTSSIDGEKHRKCYATPHKANEGNHFEESKVKVPIKRLVGEHILVLDASERL
jgi:hypothetical protein